MGKALRRFVLRSKFERVEYSFWCLEQMLRRLDRRLVVVVSRLMKLGHWRLDLRVQHVFLWRFLLFCRSCIIANWCLSLQNIDWTHKLSSSAIGRDLILRLILQLYFRSRNIHVLSRNLLSWNRNGTLWCGCRFLRHRNWWRDRIGSTQCHSLRWFSTLDYHLACLWLHGLSTHHRTGDIFRPLAALPEVWALPSDSAVGILDKERPSRLVGSHHRSGCWRSRDTPVVRIVLLRVVRGRERCQNFFEERLCTVRSRMVRLTVILEWSLLDRALARRSHVLHRKLLGFLLDEIHLTHGSCLDG